MNYSVKDGENQLDNYIKKYEIINKTYSLITKAFIKVSKYAE